ncbi:trigger factor [Allonocardiopsis opalescens]|uniref:Trigger factor n=1 Tax=Allonocardiopsis opalescens TaxID=1144618 RepID=A0A2T0PSA5_9ACTN|nr:trigger factor [Allonocardiopsis opalescens]PRX91764.1 trigger factor [Allonocardiopsis opalescens]
MKTDVEELSPTRVKLTIEVPFEELGHAFDETYKTLRKQVRIKGFRPGKVPTQLIDRYVGRGVVVSEAVNHAVPEFYNQAVREEEIFALGQPDFEVTNLEDGAEFSFTAEVDVRPKFEVKDYEGVSVTVDDAAVSDEDVDQQLSNLRERFATLTGADRPAAEGDYVSIDLQASVDGVELEDVKASGVSYEIGSGSLLDGLDAAVTGLSAGESTTFATTLVGGEHEGRAADVAVTVHSVKVKELPELDDEFAQSASEFDTIEELRDDSRRRLAEVKEYQQVSQARDRVLEALVDKVDIPLPDSAIEAEVNRRTESLEQQLQASGLTREAYLESQGKSEEEFETELAEGARKAVKSGFVLDQLAIQEDLSADNSELTNYVVDQAQRMGVSPEVLIKHMVDSNQIHIAYTEVLRAKALTLVLRTATVVDESGNEVDVRSVLGDEAETAAAPEAEGEAADTEIVEMDSTDAARTTASARSDDDADGEERPAAGS